MDRINNNIKFYTFIDILETYSDKNVSLSIKEINNHMKKRLGIVLDRSIPITKCTPSTIIASFVKG